MAASAVAGISLMLIFSIAAKTATFGRVKPSRSATQIALRIMSTFRPTSGLMFTAGSDRNISRLCGGKLERRDIAQQAAARQARVAVQNRPEDDVRIYVPLHQHVGLAVAAKRHGLQRDLLRIGLIDDFHPGQRDFQRSAQPHDAAACRRSAAAR